MYLSHSVCLTLFLFSLPLFSVSSLFPHLPLSPPFPLSRSLLNSPFLSPLDVTVMDTVTVPVWLSRTCALSVRTTPKATSASTVSTVCFFLFYCNFVLNASQILISGLEILKFNKNVLFIKTIFRFSSRFKNNSRCRLNCVCLKYS